MRALCLLSLLASLCASGVAAAAPLVDSHVGGMVFVGPTSAHPSALYWNPAAASLLKGTHAVGLGDVRLDWVHASRDSIDTGTGEPSATGNRSFDPNSYLGMTTTGFAGIVSDLGTDRITLGFAFYHPFAEELPDGDQTTGYHGLTGAFYGQAYNVSASVRINGTASVGVGVTFLSTEVQMSFLRDTALDTCTRAPCNPPIEDPAHAERISINTGFNSLFSTSYLNLGLLLHLGQWVVGAAFATPPATSVLSGYVLQREDTNAQVTLGGGASPTTVGARVTMQLPWTIHFGVRRRLFGDWDLLINSRYQNLSYYEKMQIQFFGSTYQSLGLPDTIQRWRGFSDVFSLETGLEDQPGKPVRLGARLRFETTGVPASSVAFDQVDAAKLELSGGAELRVSRGVAVVLGAAVTGMLPVSAHDSAYTPSSQIACNASGFDLDTCSDSRNGRAIPTAAGTYHKLTGEFSLGISLDIW